MKVIIAGSRGIGPKTTRFLLNALADHIKSQGIYPIDEVVSGTAAGVDKGGELYAEQHDITITRMPADWDHHGRSAGYIRNKEMANHADALIALWDGKSSGTRHMIEIASKKGMKTVTINTSL